MGGDNQCSGWKICVVVPSFCSFIFVFFLDDMQRAFISEGVQGRACYFGF